MKFQGDVKFKRKYPDSVEYIAVVKGLSWPIKILIPDAQGLEADGTIVIDIPNPGEKPKPKEERSKGKGKK